MPNMLDYLAWRGDLRLEDVPFTDIDALLLSRFAYMPLDGIVPSAFDEPAPLGEAASRVLALCGAGQAVLPMEKDDRRLLEALLDSPRFASVPLCGFVNVFDALRQEQFAALTALIPGGAVVAFRGTDGTLVGWKEDFNMAFSPVIPAQADAVGYVTTAARRIQGHLTLCGHSKGGNLAVYAGAFCPEDVQCRVLAVRNFDGPGFGQEAIAREGFARILPRTRTYLPQSSVVGMLLEHEEDFTIVDSRSVSIWQHNPYLWEVRRDAFITADTRTNSSQFIDHTLKEWVRAMPPGDREKLINAVFAALGAQGEDTVRDVMSGKRAIALIRAMGDMDEDTRHLVSSTMHILRLSLKSSLPGFMDRLRLPGIAEHLPDALTGHLPASLDRLLFHRPQQGNESS